MLFVILLSAGGFIGCKLLEMGRLGGRERNPTVSGGLLGINLDAGDAGWVAVPVVPAVWLAGRRRRRRFEAVAERLVDRIERAKSNKLSACDLVEMLRNHDDDTERLLQRLVRRNQARQRTIRCGPPAERPDDGL